MEKAKFIIEVEKEKINEEKVDIRIVLPWPEDDDRFTLNILQYGAEIFFDDRKEFLAFQKKIAAIKI